MGRRCAWCETVLPAHGGAWSPASDAVCRGCFEELEIALARTGLRFGAQSSSPGPDSEPQVIPTLGEIPLPTAG
jgi:hypothetical protein